MILYALPDTKKIGLTEAQAYAVVWDTFHNIQKKHLMPSFIMVRNRIKRNRPLTRLVFFSYSGI